LNLTIVDSLVVNIPLTPVGSSVGTLTGRVTGIDTTVFFANARVLLTGPRSWAAGVTTVPADSVLTNASGVLHDIGGRRRGRARAVPAHHVNDRIRCRLVPGNIPGGFGGYPHRELQACRRCGAVRIINGTVTDSASLAAIQGALVVLRRQPVAFTWVRIDSTVTMANGSFAFKAWTSEPIRSW